LEPTVGDNQGLELVGTCVVGLELAGRTAEVVVAVVVGGCTAEVLPNAIGASGGGDDIKDDFKIAVS